MAVVRSIFNRIWNTLVFAMRKTVDWRFLYFLQYGNRMIFKIGISHDHEIRRGQVEKAFGNRKVRRWLALPLFFAGRIEKRLHRKYQDYSHDFKQKVGKGGGRTEWFQLKPYHIFAVLGDMFTRALLQYGFLVFLFYIGYLKYFGFDVLEVLSQHFQNLKITVSSMIWAE